MSAMAKYDPIARFLRRRQHIRILLTFADIERIIGAVLPRAAKEPGWWSEEGSAQCSAWCGAGYRADLVSGSEAVWFKRPVVPEQGRALGPGESSGASP